MRTLEQVRSDQVEATRVASRLRLPLGARVWKGQAGEFQGAGTGSSLDFQDHRDYHPGDDPRHLNWQAYARTGQYTMKMYREEVRPVVDLWIDVSPSMWVDEKAERSSQMIYFFADCARRAGASFQAILVHGDAISPVLGFDEIFSHDWLSQADKLDSLTSAPTLAQVQARGRPNALRVWLSDLLFDGEPRPILRHLHARQGAGFIFAPFSQSEADPDWEGDYEFIDAETEERQNHRLTQDGMGRYLGAYQSHFRLWNEACRRHQISFNRVPCEGGLFAALNQGTLDLLP